MTLSTSLSTRRPMVEGYGILAGLFEYPREDYAAAIADARPVLEDALDEAGRAAFEAFADALLALAPEAREELHAATFEITPACIPYVSLHLFGEESFKRGAFMAALNARYESTGFDARGELPDHVTTIVRFAGEIDATERRELAAFCLLAPFETMIGGLSAANPYRALLETVRALLAAEFPGLEPVQPPADRGAGKAAACGPAVSAGCGCGPVFAPEAEVDDD